jgi:hypothetical protein
MIWSTDFLPNGERDEMIKLNAEAPAWPVTNMLERLQQCRSMLYLHGFLSDAERDRVNARLHKAIQKHQSSQGKPADEVKP